MHIFHSIASLTEHLSQRALKEYSGVTCITDDNVFELYGETLVTSLQENDLNMNVAHISLSATEQAKTLHSAASCWNAMIQSGVDRESVVVGLGGGVVTDIAGFVASGYMRGVDSILIPTTLLGMVDAAIGGKTGVNLPEGKNLIGSFHHPKHIFIALEFLDTLPERELRSGLAEVIKCGVIASPQLLEQLEQLEQESYCLEEIIRQAVAVKNVFVERDPEDRLGLRANLNFGHTFAHAIEASTGYTRYTHGEAVAIGMSCAACLSGFLGYSTRETQLKIDDLCQHVGLPTTLPPDVSLSDIVDKMKRDKKSVKSVKSTQNGISCILLKTIGDVFPVHNIPSSAIIESLLAKKREKAGKTVWTKEPHYSF